MKLNHLSLFVVGCLLSQDANAQFLCEVVGNCNPTSTYSRQTAAAATYTVGSNSLFFSSTNKESNKFEYTYTTYQQPTYTTYRAPTYTTTTTANLFATPYIGFPSRSSVYTTQATFSDFYTAPATTRASYTNDYRETYGASSRASSSWNSTTTTSSTPSSSLSSTPSSSAVSNETSDDGSSKKTIIIGASCAAAALVTAGLAYVFLTQRKKANERAKRLNSMISNEPMEVGYDDCHTHGGSNADNNKTTTRTSPYGMSEPQAYNSSTMVSPQPPLLTVNPTDPYYPPPQMTYNPNEGYYSNQAYYDGYQHHYPPPQQQYNQSNYYDPYNAPNRMVGPMPYTAHYEPTNNTAHYEHTNNTAFTGILQKPETK